MMFSIYEYKYISLGSEGYSMLYLCHEKTLVLIRALKENRNGCIAECLRLVLYLLMTTSHRFLTWDSIDSCRSTR